ncbi:unnamed protein product [Polarella glacialis]|uniref:Protein kinase domain-containing protein n=1 Tax=Polarella glacialis TaxID=89957 RepID=A0A813LRR9_POLGL|nr:unnamed protein product [Polarella glacialis]
MDEKEDDEGAEEEDMPEDLADLDPEEQQKRIKIRAFSQMAMGTLLVLIFSDPMVDLLSEIGKRVNVSAFYISFVLAPLASNASELVAAYNYAKKRTCKSITTSLSTLEGAAIMNNTFCLAIFLGLVYFKNLAWEFSAETACIIFVQVMMALLIMTRRVQTLLDGCIIISFYPVSLLMVWACGAGGAAEPCTVSVYADDLGLGPQLAEAEIRLQRPPAQPPSLVERATSTDDGREASPLLNYGKPLVAVGLALAATAFSSFLVLGLALLSATLGLPVPLLAVLPSASAALFALQLLAFSGSKAGAPPHLADLARPLARVLAPRADNVISLCVLGLTAVWLARRGAAFRHRQAMGDTGDVCDRELPHSLTAGAWEFRALGIMAFPLATASAELLLNLGQADSAAAGSFVAVVSLSLLVHQAFLATIFVSAKLPAPAGGGEVLVDRVCNELRALPTSPPRPGFAASLFSDWLASPGWCVAPAVAAVQEYEFPSPDEAEASERSLNSRRWEEALPAAPADEDDLQGRPLLNQAMEEEAVDGDRDAEAWLQELRLRRIEELCGKDPRHTPCVGKSGSVVKQIEFTAVMRMHDPRTAGTCGLTVVWLHSSHQQEAEAGVARKPHPWCPPPIGVSTLQSRELAIRTLVERAATGFELSIVPSDLDSGNVSNSLEGIELSIIPRPVDFEVMLGTSDLLISSTLESNLFGVLLSVLRVQLLFSDVMWTSVPFAGESAHTGFSINGPVSPHYIVAVVPHEDEQICGVAAEGGRNTEPVSAAHGLPFQEAWLLCVGACSQSEFQDFLRELGCRGAVRWDLKECYHLVRELNSGTFATVHLGQSFQNLEGSMISPASNSADVQLASQVAVKGLRVQAQLMQSVVKSEIDFLVQSKGHPNITKLYSIFCSCSDSGTECSEANEQSDPASSSQLCWSIVMDFFPTGDLHDYLARRGPLNQADGMEIFCGVMSALAHLHFCRVAHRDVKSENILLSDKGQAILADFGSAAHIDDHLAMKENTGSPGYAAPEVVDARPYGVMADVFSAGVVLYFALSNELPFPGDVPTRIRRTSRCKVRFDLSKFGHLSGDVLALLRSLLEKNPQLRPDSGCCFEVSWLCLPAEVQCRSHATLVGYTTLVPNSAQRLQQQDQNPQEQQQEHGIPSDNSLSQGMNITIPSSSSSVTSSTGSPKMWLKMWLKDVFNPQSCREQRCFVSRLHDSVEESRLPLLARVREENERFEDEGNLQVQGGTDTARASFTCSASLSESLSSQTFFSSVTGAPSYGQFGSVNPVPVPASVRSGDVTLRAHPGQLVGGIGGGRYAACFAGGSNWTVVSPSLCVLPALLVPEPKYLISDVMGFNVPTAGEWLVSNLSERKGEDGDWGTKWPWFEPQLSVLAVWALKLRVRWPVELTAKILFGAWAAVLLDGEADVGLASTALSRLEAEGLQEHMLPQTVAGWTTSGSGNEGRRSDSPGMCDDVQHFRGSGHDGRDVEVIMPGARKAFAILLPARSRLRIQHSQLLPPVAGRGGEPWTLPPCAATGDRARLPVPPRFLFPANDQRSSGTSGISLEAPTTPSGVTPLAALLAPGRMGRLIYLEGAFNEAGTSWQEAVSSFFGSSGSLLAEEAERLIESALSDSEASGDRPLVVIEVLPAFAAEFMDERNVPPELR